VYSASNCRSDARTWYSEPVEEASTLSTSRRQAWPPVSDRTNPRIHLYPACGFKVEEAGTRATLRSTSHPVQKANSTVAQAISETCVEKAVYHKVSICTMPGQPSRSDFHHVLGYSYIIIRHLDALYACPQPGPDMFMWHDPLRDRSAWHFMILRNPEKDDTTGCHVGTSMVRGL
jgi:hypothetical protein